MADVSISTRVCLIEGDGRAHMLFLSILLCHASSTAICMYHFLQLHIKYVVIDIHVYDTYDIIP